MIKSYKDILTLFMLALLGIIIFWYISIVTPNYTYGQEVKQIASWNNSKTTDLGNGHKRFEMTVARSFYIEQERNVVGNIIVIRNISGTDTISYIPSNFTNYYGEIIGGNWVDNFDINDSTFTLNIIKGDIEVVNDTVITNPITVKKDTIEKHIRLFSKGSSVMKVLNIKGFDVDGKVVKLKTLEKDGKKIKGEFEKEVKKVDPTWSWQPDATAGIDNLIMGDAPTTNMGTQVDIYLGMYNTPAYRTLIKFSVLGDSIPKTAIINSAKIELTMSNKLGTPSTIVHAFILKRNWVETQSTWNIYSTGNNWGVAGAYGSDDIYMSDSTVTTSGVDWAGKDTVDIINCVKKLAGVDSAYTNYGLLLRLAVESGTNRASWYSSDEAVEPATSRPKIVIDYSNDQTPPTAETGILRPITNGTIAKPATNGTIRREVYYP